MFLRFHQNLRLDVLIKKKVYTLSGFCKFNENCSYLHKTINTELKSKLEEEVASLSKKSNLLRITWVNSKVS